MASQVYIDVEERKLGSSPCRARIFSPAVMMLQLVDVRHKEHVAARLDVGALDCKRKFVVC